MNKAITILIIVFFITVLLPKAVFALAAPIEEKYWYGNFNSSGSCDNSRSNVAWESGSNAMSLKRIDDDSFSSSGVCWTDEIGFGQDIYSLTLSGIYLNPSGTQVKVFAKFKDKNEEYPLSWGAVYEPKDAVRKFRLKIFLATANSNVSPNVSQVCLGVKLQDRSTEGMRNRDNSRVSELKRMKDVLERYYQDFNYYPIVGINERQKQRQWDLLKNILDSASLTYYENYNSGFINQPKGVDEDYQYGYLTGASGLYYLLWTKLENVDSEHFKDSWQGKILDVDCTPPVYCLYSKPALVAEPLLQYFGEQKETNGIQGAEFVKTENNPQVWLQLNNYRFWLRTPEIFEKAGGLWDKINLKASLAEIPLLKFVRQKDEPEVYLVTSSGLKRHLPNSQILYLYGQAEEIVALEDKKMIDLLPENYLIRGKGQDKVYFLDQKIKRWITSPETLEKMGFDWSEVVEIEAQELDYYPEGSPIF